MALTFRATGCCGIQELTSLSTHTLPEEAMKAFCVQMLGTVRKVQYADRVLGDFNNRPNHLYSFYLFTAAVYEPGKGNHRPYGENFAAFIKAHRLGDVSTLPARTNFAFHPDHKVQAWLWKPRLAGLKAWYKLLLDKEEAELQAKILRQAEADKAAKEANLKWIAEQAAAQAQIAAAVQAVNIQVAAQPQGPEPPF